ncbi:C-type lectin protein [Aphelenchoides avenae]|nr:C-type lectin protein [Aphelenchus avenae]
MRIRGVGPGGPGLLAYPASLVYRRSQDFPEFLLFLVSLGSQEYPDSPESPDTRPHRARHLHPYRHRLQCGPGWSYYEETNKCMWLHENYSLSGWPAFDQACAQDADRVGAIGTGSLVSIHTSGEQNFAHSLARPLTGPLDHTGGVSVWIGGHKTEMKGWTTEPFRWSSKIDSPTFDYTFWAPPNPAINHPGMPDNDLGRTPQNCVRLQPAGRPAISGLRASNGEWDDIDCYNALFKAGICQARPLCTPSGRQ